MRGIAIVFIGGNINSIYHYNSIYQAEHRFLGCLPDTCSLSVHHSIYNLNSIYSHDSRFLWNSRVLSEFFSIVFNLNSFRERPVHNTFVLVLPQKGSYKCSTHFSTFESSPQASPLLYPRRGPQLPLRVPSPGPPAAVTLPYPTLPHPTVPYPTYPTPIPNPTLPSGQGQAAGATVGLRRGGKDRLPSATAVCPGASFCAVVTGDVGAKHGHQANRDAHIYMYVYISMGMLLAVTRL
jgi:hypothetical protein